MNDTRTKTVQGISTMHMPGNILPHTWYRAITLQNGKPDLNGIVILADIVYWYKETIVKDEATSEILERKNKFAADKLQKTYRAYADLFGLSERQVKAAIDRLVSAGIITREFRTIHTKTGLTLSNVMYLEPVVEALMLIEHGQSPPGTIECTTPPQSNVPDDTANEGTCTDITSDTTPKIKSMGETPGASAPAPAIPVSFQEWQKAILESRNRAGTLHTMIETLYPSLETPSFSYINRAARAVGGAGRLADLLWQTSSHPPTGDLLAYIQAMAKNGKDKRNGQQPTSSASDAPEPPPNIAEILKRMA